MRSFDSRRLRPIPRPTRPHDDGLAGPLAPTFLSELGRLAIAMAVALIVLGCPAPERGEGARVAPLDLDAAGMKAATVEMLTTMDILERHRRLLQLIDALDEDNLPGALEGYEENLTKVEPHEGRVFANAWAKIDARGAMDRILDRWTYDKLTNEVALEVVYVWVASGDAEAARAYVDPSYEGPIAARHAPAKFVVRGVLKALAVAGEYDQLTQMFAGLDDDGPRELYLTQTMIEMNRAQGEGNIRDWIDSIPWDAPNNLKVSALKRGLDWVSKMSGPHAAAWWAEYESEPRALEVLPMAVKAWGVQDPAAAIDWLAERQTTTVQRALIMQIGQGWLERNPEAAETWMRSEIERPVIRENLTLVLANGLANAKRFAEAAEVAKTTPDSKQRETALAALLHAWSSYDAKEVEAYIAAKNLPESVVQLHRKRQAESPVKLERRKAKSAQEGQG